MLVHRNWRRWVMEHGTLNLVSHSYPIPNWVRLISAWMRRNISATILRRRLNCAKVVSNWIEVVIVASLNSLSDLVPEKMVIKHVMCSCFLWNDSDKVCIASSIVWDDSIVDEALYWRLQRDASVIYRHLNLEVGPPSFCYTFAGMHSKHQVCGLVNIQAFFC